MGILLGVRIDQLTNEQALDRAANFLLGGAGSNTIFTPNPEMLVMARKNPAFRLVLNHGSLNICDGFGTHLFSGAPRIAGSDFMLDLCRLAEEQGRSIYLLGGRDVSGISATEKQLQTFFPKLKIAGSHVGPHIALLVTHSSLLSTEENNSIIQDIIAEAPDILFVAFGHGKQEWWISEYLKRLPSVKIAMGVGGAFDMLARKQKRAPRLVRTLGLEWLWRFTIEPKRWKRIFTAVILFPLFVLLEKIRGQQHT